MVIVVRWKNGVVRSFTVIGADSHASAGDVAAIIRAKVEAERDRAARLAFEYTESGSLTKGEEMRLKMTLAHDILTVYEIENEGLHPS